MKSIRKRLKYIFPILIVIMVVGLILSRVYQPEFSPPEPEVRIEASEATDYIGTAAEVCGRVASTDYVPQLGGEPTFINLGRAHPNQLFTAVIWNSDRAKWIEQPEQLYLKEEICISGMIEMHEGTPQIIVESPEQIEIQ
jgi:hypothetical protein